MTTNYYDAVVIGTEIGPLAAGALLARRGFRVLVVGQDAPEDAYDCLGYRFSRRPFLLVSLGSPAFRRVVNEIRIGQLLSHALFVPSPAFQLILPGARVDVHADLALTRAELDRELPAPADLRDRFFERVGLVNGEIDKLLASDLIVPPGTFFEKREFARAEVQNPFRGDADPALWRGLGGGDGAAELFELPVRLETAGTRQIPPLVRYRRIGGWLADCRAVAGGRDALSHLFAEQIAAQGGDRQLNRRVTEIAVRRGRVEGVRLSGREALNGCRVVLTDRTPAEIGALIPPASWPRRFRSQVEASPRPALGYALNLGVDREVIPEGLAGTAFAAFGPGAGDALIRVEQLRQADPGKAALQVSCAVPFGEEDRIRSGALRDALLDRMRWLVPFLDNHLRVIHSPFDGFGPIDLTGRAGGPTPPSPHLEEVQRWPIRLPSADGVLGIENLPHRTGIRGLLLAGSQVITGLGVEGEMIAAWGAARIAGRLDPRRERLVRSMRGRVEI